MNPTTPDQDAALKQALALRRREHAVALRACLPPERRFLRHLPKARYEPYRAAHELGMSTKTIWNMLKRPRVRMAMQLFLRDALDDIGVSHASLVADLLEIKDRCMQAKPVLDRKGTPTGEYQFDAHGAIAAITKIADLMKLAPPKRIELTGRDGERLAPPVFNISFEDGAPGEQGIDVSHPMGDDPANGQSTTH